MDLAKVLAQLREELENLDAAILTLERLRSGGRHRGRPPELLAEMRRSGSAAARRGGSEAQASARGRKAD
jgi:hypothetical protein